MTRILSRSTLLTAILVALTAAAMRYELAAPGVSALFSDASGAPDGRLFHAVSITHGMLCYLCVMLIGTTMMSVARDQGAKLGGVFLALGTLATAATALFTLALFLPSVSAFVAALIDRLAANLSDTLIYIDMSVLFTLPAAALLYVGAYAMLSTLPRMAWMGVIGAAFVAIVLIATYPFVFTPDFAFSGPFRVLTLYALIGARAADTLTSPAILMALPFLICALTCLASERPPWLVFMVLGILALTTFRFALTAQPTPLYIDSTMYSVALDYLLPLGLAWVALPAVLAAQNNTALPLWAVFGAVFTIAVGLYQWLGPLAQLGLMGQPMRYVDYPNPFTELNLKATRAVFGFMVFYGYVVLIAAKGRP